MSEKEIHDQTAFEVAGIPTPPNEENATPTDMVSGAVEKIMDNIQNAFQGDKKTTQDKRQPRH